MRGACVTGLHEPLLKSSDVSNTNSGLVAAVAKAGFSASDLDEDAAHGLGGSAEEMPATVPMLLLGPDQTQIRFVHERGRLQGMPGGFLGHFGRRELAEFIIDQREQFCGSLGIAMIDGFQDARDFAHARMDSSTRAAKEARKQAGVPLASVKSSLCGSQPERQITA